MKIETLSGPARRFTAAVLAAALLAGCMPAPRLDGAATRDRVDRAVDDASDPSERGGERGVPRSAPAYDRRP